MFLHRTFAVALLAVLLAAPCAGVCVGWETSAHARMACCEDESQNDADACCALGEGRQNAVSAGLVAASLAAPAADADQIDSILSAPQIFTPHWDGHDRMLSDTDRHVRLSVFLI